MILPAALHQTDARTTFAWDSLIVFLSARLFRCEGLLVFTLFHYELFTVAIKQQTVEDTILNLRKLWSQVFSVLLKVLSMNQQIGWWWRWSLVASFISKAESSSLAADVTQSQIHAVMLLLYQPAADWDRNLQTTEGRDVTVCRGRACGCCLNHSHPVSLMKSKLHRIVCCV